MLLPPLTAHGFGVCSHHNFWRNQKILPAGMDSRRGPKFHSIALSGYVSKVFPPSLQSLTLEKLSELACYITFPLQDMIINAQRTGRGLLEVHDFRCPQIIASHLTSLGLFFFRSSWRVTTQHNMYVMTSHNCYTCRETLHIDLAAKHALTAYSNSSCTFMQGS